MGATWVRWPALTFVVLWMPGAVLGEGQAPAAPATAPSVAPEVTAAPADPATIQAEADAVRVETAGRLKRLAGPEEKDATAGKELRKVLEERLHWLDEWALAVKARHAAEHPEPSPEVQAGEWKADLERSRTLIEQLARAPTELLPGVFHRPAAQVNDAARAEMKDAIEAAESDLKAAKDKLEKLRAEGTRKATNPLAAPRAERDKIHQRVAALPPRRAEREAALAAAKTPRERALAGERLVNFEWEARVENERLLGQEARIALETRRCDLSGLSQQVCDARVLLAAKMLEQMQSRYQALTVRQERDLKRAAASEQKRAARIDDPLERYRVRWSALLLDLRASVLKHENALTASSSPSFEEQKGLADRAESDFAGIKHLLDDGKVSHLDALRFNNDFRRIGPQRARIVSHELNAAAQHLTYYENALSGVELELINDTRADQYEHESLLEQLPKARHPEAKALFAALDAQHELLLNKDRAALEKLASRAEDTHKQILRRLRILDDQYGFIRTHIFWVRDQEPIGGATLARAQRDTSYVGRTLVRLFLEAGDRTLWGRVSAEFIAAVVGLLVLPWPLYRIRAALARRPYAAGRLSPRFAVMRGLLLGVGVSAVAPLYLGLWAYAARQAPWPRSLALPAASALAVLVPALFLTGLCRWLLRPGGWFEQELRLPEAVSRQLHRAVLVLVVAGVPLFLPPWLLGEGLIAPAGRPIEAPALCRVLELGLELIVWGIVFRLARGHSPLVQWLLQFPERLGWLNRRRRALCWSALAALGGVIALDTLGYRFSASRLALGAVQGMVLGVVCWGLYRMLLRAIDHHAWRWIRLGHFAHHHDEPRDPSAPPDDLANRLRRLAAYLVPALGLIVAAWAWDVDWALFRVLGESKLWNAETDTPVTVGDFTRFALILGVTAAIWRHLTTFFAVAVFPRMRDDPGVRFAIVTLCRYAVLGMGLLAGLSAIHLGLEKIGMVLAALGVGLGFGLQEIVSNFVCGIILLLERPIRVGDLVTVSGMTGKVDRINIRATTITNGDNQSIIVPNRAFITSDLVNWTLKDKVIRVSLRLKVAHGTDPDRVSELLLGIAREDADVLRNPLPASYMEDFSESALNFVLHVHVPEPSLGSRIRHRLFAQIQKRFAEVGIEIPLPTQELRVQPLADASARAAALSADFTRVDPPATIPPAPRFVPPTAIPAAVEECHRGVDE